MEIKALIKVDFNEIILYNIPVTKYVTGIIF